MVVYFCCCFIFLMYVCVSFCLKGGHWKWHCYHSEPSTLDVSSLLGLPANWKEMVKPSGNWAGKASHGKSFTSITVNIISGWSSLLPVMIIQQYILALMYSCLHHSPSGLSIAFTLTSLVPPHLNMCALQWLLTFSSCLHWLAVFSPPLDKRVVLLNSIIFTRILNNLHSCW